MQRIIIKLAVFLSAMIVGVGGLYIGDVFDFFSVEEVPVVTDNAMFVCPTFSKASVMDSYQITPCVEEIKYKPNRKSPTIKRGVLNGLIICGELPDYPSGAVEKNISGAVILDVSADDTGRVIKVTVREGNSSLHTAAVKAAYQSRIYPTLLGGKFMQITGTLAYSFSRETGVTLPKKSPLSNSADLPYTR